MARRVTYVVINETDSSLIATGATLNFSIDQGTLTGTMPVPIAARGQGSFVVEQSASSTVGPSGWVCYELEHQNLVYYIRFGDPSLGADAFVVKPNYLDNKLGDAVISTTYAAPSGPVDAAAVAQQSDLTVQFHLGFTPGATGKSPTAGGAATQSVAGAANGTSSVTIPPYVATWNQKGISQHRKKVLAAIGKVYPMLWQALGGKAPTAAPENGGGTYQLQGEWHAAGTSCTSSCPMVGAQVSPKTANVWNFAAYNSPAWVPWGTTQKMPSVGDVYILYRDELVRPLPAKVSAPTDPKAADYDAKQKAYKAYLSKVALSNPYERHVGIIVGSPFPPVPTSGPFTTADGGQTAFNVQAAHLVKRKWVLRKPGPVDTSHTAEWEKNVHPFAKPIADIEYPYLVGGAESTNPADGNRLIGWLDIDQIAFTSDAFDGNGSEANYNTLGARIDSMPG